jgi:PHD/YefM family antitoxin component YafN of YafNO toxin-antitoxin module
MITIQKKIVVDENGVPQEVIIPWAQFCELSEALGLDLDEEAMADLREAKADVERGERASFAPVITRASY